MVAAAPTLRARPVWLGAPVLAATYAIAVLIAPQARAGILTTYGDASVALRVADLVAGLTLVVGGALAWLEPRARRVGLLVLLAGVAWFGPDWEGWQGGPAAVRSLGALAAPLVLALVFHLALAFPNGWPRGRLGRRAVVAVYGIATVVIAGRALFRDPFLDPYCWRNCSENVFLVHADQGLAQALDDVWLRAATAIAVLLVTIAVGRLVLAGRVARRALSPVLAPAAVAAAAEAAYAVALIRNPAENPHGAGFASIFIVRSASLTLLAVGVVANVAEAHRRRLVVARLASDLGEAPPPGKLQEALAAAVGDPALRVAYWLSGSRRFVDADGNSIERPVPRPGRAVTPIIHAGQPVALVEHDSALLDRDELEREIGSAATLAIENERLQAEARAQLDDLRASRARIVETGDAARRRLERDLHDGAQQRLLALSYDLRLARAKADADGDAELTAVLASAADEAQAALDDLRELAHGIYPAILAEAGLEPALQTFADEAPLPAQVEATSERFDMPVEAAVYRTVTGAIEDAAGRAATRVFVDVAREGERVIVTVKDDGAARTTQLLDVADRVGALGGVVDAGPTTLRAEIPCA